ncbi:MAG: hypothetical protein JST49_05200 [Bacteroidetes bacterium]|nr:hypothetical protein [Bacteroidota bacterium]
MSRKKNEQQQLLKEQEEFDVKEDGTLDTATPYNETPAPTGEDEQEEPELIVNQTYLTEDTLPEGYGEEEPVHTMASAEEEEGDEYEEEEGETSYEEEGDGELEEEGEYEYEQAGEPDGSKISLVVDRVLASIKDADGNIDKAQIAKYAGVAVLGIYGLSRKSLLGKIIVSGVVSLLAKQLLDSKAAQQESEVDEDEAVAA